MLYAYVAYLETGTHMRRQFESARTPGPPRPRPPASQHAVAELRLGLASLLRQAADRLEPVTSAA